MSGRYGDRPVTGDPIVVRNRQGDTGQVIGFAEGTHVKVEWNDGSESWHRVEDVEEVR